MRRLGSKFSILLLTLASTLVLLLLNYKLYICNVQLERFLMDGDKNMIEYDRNMPLIIIGGVTRSGADLLRAVLDAHSEVRCDEGIFVNSWVFNIMKEWTKKEQPLLDQLGVSKNVLDAAVAAFILTTLALKGEPARRLCTNSPFMLRSADLVSRIFPQAKFILVVRDGRAVVHSILSHQLKLKGYNIFDSRESLETWNNDVSTMYYQCRLVGRRRCLLVRYEQLVLHPESWMKRILSFVQVPWDESVFHHETKYRRGFLLEKYINSDPVEGPINVESLTKWVDQFPLEVVLDMDTIAPMLLTLGYDPTANPPNYGRPDKFLLHNMRIYNEN